AVRAAVGMGAVAVALAAAACGGQRTLVETQTVIAPAAATTTSTVVAPLHSAADVVASVLPSVVNVRTQNFGGAHTDGSGVVIDRRGIIVTNYHVIEGGRIVTVAFN